MAKAKAAIVVYAKLADIGRRRLCSFPATAEHIDRGVPRLPGVIALRREPEAASLILSSAF